MNFILTLFVELLFDSKAEYTKKEVFLLHSCAQGLI